MKNNLLALVALSMSALTSVAQTMKEWDDVSITHVNREAAHTLSIPVENEAAVDANAMEASPYYMSLNGVWKFRWVADPSKRPANFQSVTYNDVAWDNIDVPSTWQVYGVRHGKSWDKPLYCNVAYPFSFDKTTLSVMADRPGWFTYGASMKNPVGNYRRKFTVPAEWDGRDVFLRFNGAGHGYYVWVNGQYVGYAEDSYLPSEFKITDYLTEGENTLAVQVYRFTSGSLIEAQDYWRLTGITRDVFLWSAPKSRIRDFYITNTLTGGYTAATLNVETELAGEALTDGRLTLKVMDGTAVVAEASAAVATDGKTTLSASLTNPRLWNAEQPNLYNVVLTLSDANGTVDVRGCKWGFRDIKVGSKGEICINGKPIIIHGVDRHDHSMVGGRTVTREEMEKDIFLMKKLNINALRTSHYPNNPYLYDLCDKYGIYVLAEANVECHPYQQLSSEPKMKQMMVERNENHVLWMRNHPSIFIWSFGNESGGGENFKAVSEAIYQLDKTRLRHYEGNSQWSDLTSTMYAGVDHIEWVGSSRLNETKPQPHVQCENTHAMGNSMGNQREFYDLYEKYPALAGEFIWDWKDQGLEMPVPGNPKKTYWAYGGDFGDSPNDGNFCTNGVIFPDYSYSAKALNVKKIYQPADFKMVNATTGVFTIKNKLAFANLDRYDFSYEVLEDGIKIGQGTIDGVSVAAGESQQVTLGNLLPANAKDDAAYFVRFSVRQREATDWCENGYEVAAEEFTLREALSKPVYVSKGGTKPTVTQTSATITVTGDDFSAVFSKTSGQISTYTVGGKQLISRGLKFNAFRVPTDNDGRRANEWNAMGLANLTVKVGTWTVTEENNSVNLTITNTCNGASDTSFTTQMAYCVMADGTISVSSLIDPSNKGVVLPKMGFIFEMPEGYENFTWYGRGPWENYRDRKESCFPGLYHSTVTDQWTNYVLPQENGNKEEVRFISLTSEEGTGLMVVAPRMMSSTVGHWRPTDIYTASSRKKHPYEVTFLKNNVVCIDAANRALGNASCGPDVLNKYELKAERTAFDFILMPVKERLTDEQLTAKARVASPQCSPVVVTADKGLVKMTSQTEGATIKYSTDGGETYKKYTSQFTFTQGGTVLAYAEKEGLAQSIVTSTEVPMYISKSAWKVYSVDSEQGGNERKENAIDGNSSTIWHTSYGANTTSCPHEIIIDMANTYEVTAFVYEGRGDSQNGRVKDFEVYFSNNPKVWGSPAASGTLKNAAGEQVVALASPVKARYMRLIAKSEVNGNAWSSAAEIGIQATRTSTAVSDTRRAITSGSLYYICDTESGLFLHSKTNSNGDFCLDELNTSDTSFRFRFTKLTGFSSFYKIGSGASFMNEGSSYWTCVLGSNSTTTAGWLQLESVETDYYLRGLWKGTNDYFGFDSHTPGSIIFTNKTMPARLRLMTSAEVTGVEEQAQDETVKITVEGRSVSVAVPMVAHVTLTNVAGTTIASRTVAHEATFSVDAPGTYLVKVSCKGLQDKVLKANVR